MDEANVRHLLHQLGINMQRASFTGSAKRTRWMNVSCPFAPYTHTKGTDQNPSFGITLAEDKASYYKCLSCGIKGKLASMPDRLGGYRNTDYSKLRHWAELTEIQSSVNRPVVDWETKHDQHEHTKDRRPLPNASIIDTYPRALGSPYLNSRGLVFPTPLLLNLRYDNFQHRVLFPCFDRYDRFSGFTGRSVLAEHTYSRANPKVRDYFGLDKRTLFLRLRGQQEGKKLVSEGLLDFGKLVHYGYRNAHAILGTALTPEKIDILITEGDPVYFFMDNDIAGWEALFGIPKDDGEGFNHDNAWAYQLYREIPVWIVPYPVPLGKGDPGALTKNAIDECIKRAWLFTGQAPFDDQGNPTLMPVR